MGHQACPRHKSDKAAPYHQYTATVIPAVARSFNIWVCHALGSVLSGLLWLPPDRRGEFMVHSTFDPEVHITVKDIQVDSSTCPSSIRVYLMGSKTDPFRQGRHIYLGRGWHSIRAISSVLTYLRLQGSAARPLFIHVDGRPLSSQQLSSRLQSRCQAAGVPRHYSGYSFRIGAATTAAQRGLPDHLIQMLGPWSSDAYQK